jgi:putative transposase
VHAELVLGLGLPVNLKRVARLMREAGIQGLYRRRRRGCTVRDAEAQPSADLVNRQFTVDARTGCGSLISPSIRPGKGGCTARRW